ncbi:MAG: TraB/GumN family protein [Treponema sp.]|nr:TraB/GumN family protein [Treponema sp.]
MIMENKSTQKILELNGRQIVLVGTAHVSRASIEEVERAIDEQNPDTVAIELDENRLENIENQDSWKKMDIIKVLKNRQGFLLLANIVLSSYQKRMGDGAGVKPGDEMMAAIKKARARGIPQVMVDRPVSVTLRRAWAKNSFWGKCKLFSMLIATAFSREQISETEIENLKQSSEMDTMMQELSSYLPAVKSVLIDERDFYLASKIWGCSGSKVLAVLGAGHLGGVESCLKKIAAGELAPDVSQISSVPEKSAASKAALWIIPVLIVCLIAAGFVFGGIEKGADLIGSWVLWNGILAGIGAVLGGAHILTVLVSVAGAPFTSLCPFVGIGLVAGIVQAAVRKPAVRDMENLQNDAVSLKGFYRNRILRILVIFFLTSLGSSIGTFIGGASFVSIFAR